MAEFQLFHIYGIKVFTTEVESRESNSYPVFSYLSIIRVVLTNLGFVNMFSPYSLSSGYRGIFGEAMDFDRQSIKKAWLINATLKS